MRAKGVNQTSGAKARQSGETFGLKNRIKRAAAAVLLFSVAAASAFMGNKTPNKAPDLPGTTTVMGTDAGEQQPSQLLPSPLDVVAEKKVHQDRRSAYSVGALTIDRGEGWYHELGEIGVDPKDQPQLLDRIGPTLYQQGYAYPYHAANGTTEWRMQGTAQLTSGVLTWIINQAA